MPFRFDNSYARLPEQFFARLSPSKVPSPRLLFLNETLSRELGLDVAALGSEAGVAMLAGNVVPEGADPLAMAYAGHQFGAWVPQLGDGRAILLGEILAPGGQRFDLHLKGAGRTPFSRGGDGKAAIGPVLREYIVSEAMHALGVPTTRALAAIATGEAVYRDEPLPGAVLARVAASHIRVGTFQYFYGRRDTEALKSLLEHVIQRHFPAARDSEFPALAVLKAVMERQADLIALWMSFGFIHGVMNTDNTAISGETIDFGPCAFMETFDPGTVFSSIDRQGRYAWRNQPGIAHWNLAQLAQSLLPLIPGDPENAVKLAQETLDGFPALFERARLARFAAKIGIAAPVPEDETLFSGLLAAMQAAGSDFTNTFRDLARGAKSGDFTGFQAHFPEFPDDWFAAWHARTDGLADRAEIMLSSNPAFIPRNHRVEAALDAARGGDLSLAEHLLKILARPYDEQSENIAFTQPAAPEETVHQTFCGT